jgi:hypothetical protein
MIDISRFMRVRLYQQPSSKQMLAPLLSSSMFIPATVSAQSNFAPGVAGR